MEPAFKELHYSRDIPVKEYLIPGSLAEALDMLERFKGKARVIAGGTDIIPELRRRDLQVKTLVDISRLPGLNVIQRTAGTLSWRCPISMALTGPRESGRCPTSRPRPPFSTPLPTPAAGGSVPCRPTRKKSSGPYKEAGGPPDN